MKLTVSAVLFVLFSMLTARLVWAEDKPANAPAKGTVQMSAAPVLNPVTAAFSQNGVKRCVGRVQQVTEFLTAGSTKSGAFLFTPPSGGALDRDNSLLSASLEVANGNVVSYVTESFHPRLAKDCGGVYETVTFWQNACKDVAAANFAQLKQAGALQSQIKMLESPEAMRVFLMPAGAGCVVIKKEVIY